MWTYSYTMEHDNTNMFRFGTKETWDAYGTADADKPGTPCVIGGTHKNAIEAGADGRTYLADEKHFTKYCHLIPPNNI